jgi:uncharacterized protein
MRNHYFFIAIPLLFIQVSSVNAQTDCKSEALAFQKKLNDEFRIKGESPLTEEDRAHFKKLSIFRYNADFCVEATFTPTPEESSFQMPTSSTKTKTFQKVGVLEFSIKGTPMKLSVYKNLGLTQPEYENLLFIPFKDLTSGESTYGGGRYIDIEGPLSGRVRLDFNQCYNPYCAYSTGWSCPIPPAENFLEVEVKAGVRAYGH